LEYIADAEDEIWLQNHTKFGTSSNKPLSLTMFETMLDCLEKATAFETIITLDEAERCFLQKIPSFTNMYPKGRGGPGIVTLRNVIQDIYSYWVQKRSKLKRPLLRRFWPVTSSDDTNPHLVFRPREKEKYKLRKKRMNDMDAFRKMKQLRLDFEHVRNLLDMVRKRENLSRMSVILAKEIFELKIFNIIDTSGQNRVSQVLKRDALDEFLITGQRVDTATTDKRQRAEDFSKRKESSTSNLHTNVITGSRQPQLVAGQNFGEPAPLFLHPLSNRESYVSSWSNAVPFISSYEDSHPTPTFRFRHRLRLGRGGRLCIDRFPLTLPPNIPVETTFRAGQPLPIPPKHHLLDIIPNPLDHAILSRKIEDICNSADVLGDDENDAEEILVPLQDWLATDDQVWGQERYTIGPL
jgi:enhancer of polycomb-like protein